MSRCGKTGLVCLSVLVLAGCPGVDDSPPVHPREGTREARTDARMPGAVVVNAAPEAQGLRRLAGRAYVMEEFGVAPPGNAAEVVERLKVAASRGDAVSSYALYLKLRECLDEINADANSDTVRNPSRVKQCRELSADDYASAGEWLELAAAQGSVPAALLYASDPAAVLGGAPDMLRDPDRVKAYKSRAMSYLKRAAEGGSVDALLQLGKAYRNGVMVDRSLVTSYAYYEAASVASPELVPARVVEELVRELTASELAAATQEGRRIHAKCCRN